MRPYGGEHDELTRATVAVAWLIAANKPFYPFFVWYLAGDARAAAIGSLISLPFFAAIPFLARHSARAARIALPVVGACDTFFETKLLGSASGTELFFAACIMLTALSFHPYEKWHQRGVAAFILGVFILSWAINHNAPAVRDGSPLLGLNAFGAASLMLFLAIRYSGIQVRSRSC